MTNTDDFDPLQQREADKLTADALNIARQIKLFAECVVPNCDTPEALAWAQGEILAMAADLKEKGERLLALAAAPITEQGRPS